MIENIVVPVLLGIFVPLFFINFRHFIKNDYFDEEACLFGKKEEAQA